MTPTRLPSDPCGFVLLALAVAWVGHRTVRNRPRAEAVGGFVGVVVFLAGVFAGLSQSESPAEVIVAAGTVTGFVLAVAWVLLAVVSSILIATAAVVRATRSWCSRQFGRWAAWRAARRARRAAGRVSANLLNPALATAARQTAADAERVTRERAEAERRRADARASCEIFYNLHAPEIGNRFSKEAFADYVTRHFGEEHAPEYVEQRAEQLLTLLGQHLCKVLPPLSTQTLDEILAAFEDRRTRVHNSTLHEEDKKLILVELDIEREAAIRRALQEGR